MKRYLPTLIRQGRILILLAIAIFIAKMWGQTYAFLFLAYWILCDLSDIETELIEQKERREQLWNNIFPTRKPF
ncbi:hypothetical protein [Alicyclobacillus shizuokensis]|uniref:hypothetical protein n=1 Tax=Alicyclobacillus shizuokensis TaxID=392014 RepID=UPI0008309BF4|nr:hypothetical protein [Alicyclobacillus shizuokensis]